MTNSKIIVLDADDVMLNYNHGWGNVYSKFFNQQLIIANPTAYHAADYWGVNWDNRHEEHQEFADHFTIHGWRNMEAIDGAVEATHILYDIGYKVVVISRMPASGEKDRTANLLDLNFKFDTVIGTGHPPTGNPKKPHIEAIQPVYFVDDMIANFEGINPNIRTKFVWLNVGRHHEENQRLKDVHPIHHTHPSLYHFVTTVVKP